MPDRCLGVAENVILGNLCPLGTGAFELFLDSEACKEAIPGNQTASTENTSYIIEITFYIEHMLYTFGHGEACREAIPGTWV